MEPVKAAESTKVVFAAEDIGNYLTLPKAFYMNFRINFYICINVNLSIEYTFEHLKLSIF